MPRSLERGEDGCLGAVDGDDDRRRVLPLNGGVTDVGKRADRRSASSSIRSTVTRSVVPPSTESRSPRRSRRRPSFRPGGCRRGRRPPDLLHDVTREERRSRSLSSRTMSRISRPRWVESSRGFVEDQQVGLTDQRHREHEPLGHPLRRVAAGFPVDGIDQADPLEQRWGVVVGVLRVDRELEVLAGGQPVVQLDALGEDAGSVVGCPGTAPLGVPFRNADLASRRTSEVQNDVDRRRLAGAVGTKEPNTSPSSTRKERSSECDGLTKRLGLLSIVIAGMEKGSRKVAR